MADPIGEHVKAMHVHDADVVETLFGPLVAGSRERERGLVHRVDSLSAASDQRIRLSRTDRAGILSIVVLAAAEIFRSVT